MLELKELKRIYEKSGGAPMVAVDNIDMRINKGDFISIVGKSGSGKSTLLNMIVGLLRPSSGRVLINGTELWSIGEKGMAKIRNNVIGYVPQGFSLLSNLTILDNVRLPFYLHKRKGNSVEGAMKLLEEMKLENLAERYPAQLSGGEIRRVAIARALINNPEILIADEPTGDLDEHTTEEVMDMFTRINSRGVTILMVTHEYDVTRYGNRVCRMSSGKLVEEHTRVCSSM